MLNLNTNSSNSGDTPNLCSAAVSEERPRLERETEHTRGRRRGRQIELTTGKLHYVHTYIIIAFSNIGGIPNLCSASEERTCPEGETGRTVRGRSRRGKQLELTTG